MVFQSSKEHFPRGQHQHPIRLVNACTSAPTRGSANNRYFPCNLRVIDTLFRYENKLILNLSEWSADSSDCDAVH